MSSIICKHMVALLFTAEPEQAIALEKEAEDWEREAEENGRPNASKSGKKSCL